MVPWGVGYDNSMNWRYIIPHFRHAGLMMKGVGLSARGDRKYRPEMPAKMPVKDALPLSKLMMANCFTPLPFSRRCRSGEESPQVDYGRSSGDISIKAWHNTIDKQETSVMKFTWLLCRALLCSLCPPYGDGGRVIHQNNPLLSGPLFIPVEHHPLAGWLCWSPDTMCSHGHQFAESVMFEFCW